MKMLKRAASLLMAAVLVLGLVAFAPIGRAAEGEIAASYSANLLVRTDKVTGLSSDIGGAVTRTLPAGTTLTVRGLHEAADGSYWYQVAYEGATLYTDATACSMVAQLTGDVTISGAVSPASLTYGDSFPLWGDIQAVYNDLGTISAAMYPSSDLTADPVLTSSDEADGKSYSIRKNPVDRNMKFGTIDAGVYTYVLTAQAVSHYIDNGTLATVTETVVLEKQPCVISDWENPNPQTGFGIDVSSWNGTINWPKVKAAGVEFAILQIGWGTKLDSAFLTNAQGCLDNGIPFGISLYSTATNQAQAVAEAQFIIDTLNANGLTCDLPIWMDMEDPSQKALSDSERLATVQGFCDTIEAAGFQPGLYAFLSWFNDYFTDAYYETLPKWISKVNGKNTYTGGTWMWQYSWEGQVPGISGDVNCNYYYYAQLPEATTEPVLTLGSPSVSFEGQIQYNIYFQLENGDDIPLSDMGLLTWDSPVENGTIDTAQQIIPGALTDGQQFMVHSQGIPAKNMADTLYFKVYIKLADGSYLYSDLKGYHAKVYAENLLETSTDEHMRQVCVALLNYGTAAQNHFGYKVDTPMNADLTPQQQALVQPYDASFVAPLVSVDNEKIGRFVYKEDGYTGRRPSVSFDGAFSINYYFTTSLIPDGDVTMYYWTLDDYHKAEVLTPENATGSVTMMPTGIANQYWANISDIPAKLLDQTVFAAAVYTSGGEEYSTGVLSYSVGRYCQSLAAYGDSTAALCQAAAMYGHYTKEYFNNLSS